MTTRRNVLTGLAAMPIAATGAMAGESSPADVLANAPCAAPNFAHSIDQEVFRELDVMERLLASMKRHLANADDSDPMIRFGALFDMRCNLGAFNATADWLRHIVEEQRLMVDLDAKAEKQRREAEAEPSAHIIS